MGNPPPQRITSLGKKSAAKPKPVVQKKEDDIFADFGLAAQPKFSHVASTKPSAPTSSGGGRWGQAAGISATTGASGLPTPGLATTGSMDDGDDNWDDDGDLDDLFDE